MPHSNARIIHKQVKFAGWPLDPDRLMAGTPSDDREHLPSSSTVSITVLSVKPVKFGRIFALACVEVDIDGVPVVIHRVRAIRVHPIGTRIDLPMFRGENGAWRHAITLPDEINGPIGRAVLDQLVERGLAVRGPAL
jgi:stage V sporulation protein G